MTTPDKTVLSQELSPWEKGKDFIRRYGASLAVISVIVAVLFGETILTLLKGDFTPVKNFAFIVVVFGTAIAVIMIPVTVAAYWADHRGAVRRTIGQAALWGVAAGVLLALWHGLAVPLLQILAELLEGVAGIIRAILKALG